MLTFILATDIVMFWNEANCAALDSFKMRFFFYKCCFCRILNYICNFNLLKLKLK